MSFSKETKAELSAAGAESALQKHSLVYGMLLFSKSFSPQCISFTTESKAAAALYSEELSSLTTTIVDMHSHLTRRGSGGSVYTLTVPDSGDRRRIFDLFGHDPQAVSLRVNRSNLDEEDCLRFFLRGAFLVCGSVTDPSKDYHLEFSVPYRNVAADLCRVISEVEVLSVRPRMVSRKGSFVVYIKGSDAIADLLTFMGAPMAALELLNQKVLHSKRNRANRQTNSETANIAKAAAASARQLRAIEVIRQRLGFSGLSDELREMAQLRLQYPEYNLRELGEALDPPISRSGVNHRLQKLLTIAAELETEKPPMAAQ